MSASRNMGTALSAFASLHATAARTLLLFVLLPDDSLGFGILHSRF
jgi:hypothetical protein